MYTRCRKAAAFALLVTVLVPLEARNRNADKFFAQGQASEARKEYDQALDFYERALSEDPADSS